MNIHYDQIRKRKEVILQEIRKIEELEGRFPEGELLCAKSDKQYKWYLKKEGRKEYLPRENREMAEALAMKKLYRTRKIDLQNELLACDAYLKRAGNGTDHVQELLSHAEYGRLLGRRSVSKEIAEWKTAEYVKCPKHLEGLKVKGTGGKYVRSKSEAIIDRALFMAGVPFRYESRLELGRLIFYPDFTILHPITGELYYWEHFGLMDNPDYINNACVKIRNYCENGLIPNINLILTFETKEHPLSIEKVENTVRQYFL